MFDALNFQHLSWAIALGGISAVSLPLGSMVGLAWHPKDKVTGALAAYGAGALIAALALELVAPTVADYMNSGGDPHSKMSLVNLMVGFLTGGLLFIVLDQLVNARGGFLRKSAYTLKYFSSRRKHFREQILKDLSKVETFRFVPVDAAQSLVELARPVEFVQGEFIFQQNDSGDRVYVVRTGHVGVIQNGEKIASLGSGAVLGEISLLTGAPRTASAVCESTVEALAINKNDFDDLRNQFPSLDLALKEMATKRLGELREHKDLHEQEDRKWSKEAIASLKSGSRLPNPRELREIHAQHEGAPLAIWLGILLDGIPESFVIGMGLLATLSHQGTGAQFLDIVPYTLIAGLFLSNFPEALSSSVGMKAQGLSRSKIFFLWMSLLVITAFGAGMGFMLGEKFDHSTLVAVEGMAAGAMLTMIAAAMLPEAAHKGGGNTSGLFTTLGFLSALSFKLLES